MQLTTVLSSLVVLGGFAVAAPVADAPPTEEPCVEQILCIDALNACGIKYGGCYNVCKVDQKPKPPPCPATSTVVTTKVVQLTPSATKKTTSTTSKRTLTTSTKKATTTTKKTITTAKATATSKKPTSTSKTPTPTTTKKPTTTPKPSSTCNGSGMTVCADYINECGMMYGGCFPDCKPWPTFSAPPCKVTTSVRIVPVPIPTSTYP
ncbi:hypothetical protein QBC40DRAFT_267223, partial [Triangularia verruculosa]